MPLWLNKSGITSKCFFLSRSDYIWRSQDSQITEIYIEMPRGWSMLHLKWPPWERTEFLTSFSFYLSLVDLLCNQMRDVEFGSPIFCFPCSCVRLIVYVCACMHMYVCAWELPVQTSHVLHHDVDASGRQTQRRLLFYYGDFFCRFGVIFIPTWLEWVELAIDV